MQCQKLKTYMETGRVIFLSVKSIRPNPSQPRRIFSQDALSELADSIRQHGVLQPLSVRRVQGGYELIAGERRLRAAQLAGLGEVPCLVMQMDDKESGLAAMIENLQRQDLDFVEEAQGLAALMRAQNLSQEHGCWAKARAPWPTSCGCCAMGRQCSLPFVRPGLRSATPGRC